MSSALCLIISTVNKDPVENRTGNCNKKDSPEARGSKGGEFSRVPVPKIDEIAVLFFKGIGEIAVTWQSGADK